MTHNIVSIAERKTNLQLLNKLLNTEKEAICNTLFQDLHKPTFESLYLEIKQVQHDIQYHLDNLENWTSQQIFINPLRYLTLTLTGYGKTYVESKPRGKSLIIGAWNYPINLSLQPLVGSISAGNETLVVFPALDYTPKTSTLMIALFNKYFKNNKYISAKIGGKENIAKILQTKWDFIFYTGSSKVGKIIYEEAAKQLTPVVLELGGKSPCIIDKQSNINLLVKRILWGKLTNCGQTCISPDYFLVDEKFGDEFVKILINTVKDFYGKDIKKSPDYARIINTQAFKRLTTIIENDKRFIEYGGKSDFNQLFIEPTIINFKHNKEAFLNSFSMQDEIFGPIIPIFYFKDILETKAVINKYPEPLVAYLFTSKWKEDDDIKAGSIVVNDTLIQMSSPLPFGGIGNSGIGKYHGKHSFDIFSYQRSKLIRYKWGEIPARFPPYNVPWKQFIIKISQTIFSLKHFEKIYRLGKKILFMYIVYVLIAYHLK